MPTEYVWSYSSISLFKQCPHKYFRLRIAKDVVEPPTEATMYGTEAHKAAEEYMLNDTPLPPKFSFMQGPLDTLKNKDGERLCEFRMGLTRGLQPCAFDAPDVWWHGIADLVILQGDRAWVVDYKTSKSSKYADKGQLELMALGVFAHFPQVRKVRGGLLFVVADDFVKSEYTRHDESLYWRPWIDTTAALEKALEKGAWNPRPNFTCKKWCPVEDCIHNGRSGRR